LENILSWFHLKSVPGVGNHLFKRLIERFDSPEAVLKAPAGELARVEGMTARLVEAIKSSRPPESAAAEIRVAAARGYRLLTIAEPDYPSLLRQIPDPPPYLYVKGDLAGCERPIAVVGSRNATAYGLEMTHQICIDLARLGFTVVSGMALGIDAAAHEGALSGSGRTVAVLGSGLDNIYPPQHRKLFDRIAARGAVISEFPLQAEPEAHHFPIRNRVISGMSLGTVVVEATKNSGSLITARLAAEQNREVFAVPGSIQSFKSMGTHTLIKQGAKLVENVQDILSELSLFTTASQTIAGSGPLPLEVPQRLTADETRVYRALSPYPVHIDELVRKLAIDAGRLSAILLQLELKGIVSQLPGKLFIAEDANNTPTA
jgi:DNA processing protein